MIECVSVAVGRYRAITWISVLILTALILAFPASLTLEPSTIQSVYIFENFALFVALFVTWMFLIILLLLPMQADSLSGWEGLGLVCVFGLVFLGFWLTIVPYGYGGDAISNLAHVRYLQEEGRITLTNPRYSYFDFPGTHLSILFLADITGLSLFVAQNGLMVIVNIAIVALLYVFFTNYLKKPYFAVLAVIFMFLGNFAISGKPFLHPSYFALIFLLAFLAISNSRIFETIQGRLIFLIVIIGATMTHFVTSICMFFILLSLYLIQSFAKENGRGIGIGISAVLLAIVIPMAYELYYAVRAFNSLAMVVPTTIEHIATGEIFTWPTTLGQANLVRVPTWVSTTRLFWMSLLYGLGGVLWLLELVRIRRPSSSGRIIVGGFVGVAAVSLLAGIASGTGFRFTSILGWGGIFLAPVIIRYCVNPAKRWTKVCLPVFLVTFLVLALPTFLAYHGTVSTDALHTQDISVGKFVELICGKGDNITVFSAQTFGIDVGYYYFPDANLPGPPSAEVVKNEKEFWLAIDDLIEKYKHSGPNSMFILSDRHKNYWMHILGVEPDSLGWQNLEAELSEGNMVYVNGSIEIYEAR